MKARLQRAGSLKLIDLVTGTYDEKVQGGKFWVAWRPAGSTGSTSATIWFMRMSAADRRRRGECRAHLR